MRETHPAPALFGSALGILGLGVFAAGAIPHAATSRPPPGFPDLYHAAGATQEDKATLVLVWQATQGIFDALLFTGLLVTAIGIILLGSAMRADPAFGWLSMLLGTTGLAAGVAVLIDPTSVLAVLGIFALIAFHLILGWKVYRMSRRV